MTLRTFFVRAAAISMVLTIGTAHAQGIQPASPQPDPASLSDGLAVQYWYNDFRDTSLSKTVSRGGGEVGPPLPQLNYQVGIGRVLTSKSSDFVGAKIDGYILMDKPGQWQFKVTSNDGIRLRIGHKTLFQDMSPHPDYDSEPLPVDVKEPGWYPINVLYYERKRTSTLKLWWKGPDSRAWEIVPASALKH